MRHRDLLADHATPRSADDVGGRNAQRAVRLTTDATRVGEAVRVAVSGVEVEGRITAIDGTILRVALSAQCAKNKMAKAAPRPSQRRRGKAS
jgi:hypothetical protein